MYGYRITPAYTFGETYTYRNLSPVPTAIASWFSARAIPLIIPFGCWFCPLLPNPTIGIHTVKSYGKVLPKIPEPTTEDIDTWHAWYVAEVQAVFDRNKWRFGLQNQELVVS